MTQPPPLPHQTCIQRIGFVGVRVGVWGGIMNPHLGLGLRGYLILSVKSLKSST